MSKLKSVELAPAKSKKLEPVKVAIAGKLVRTFVDAKEKFDAAKEASDAAKTQMLDAVIPTFFAQQALLKQQTPSLLFEDLVAYNEAPSDAAVMVTMQDKYGNNTVEAVDAAFKNFKGKDVNDYFRQVVVASFDNTIFQKADGSFNEPVFKDVIAALEKVMQKHKIERAPVSVKTNVTPVDDFHARRFTEFTPAQNMTLHELVPATVTVKVK